MSERVTVPDLFLCAVLAALTVALPLAAAGRVRGEYLKVRVGDRTERHQLSEDGTYTLAGPLGDAQLVVQEGRARLVNAPCPLKLCEAMGPVDGPGEAIVCVPNRIAVTVTGRSDVDAVSR